MRFNGIRETLVLMAGLGWITVGASALAQETEPKTSAEFKADAPEQAKRLVVRSTVWKSISGTVSDHRAYRITHNDRGQNSTMPQYRATLVRSTERFTDWDRAQEFCEKVSATQEWRLLTPDQFLLAQIALPKTALIEWNSPDAQGAIHPFWPQEESGTSSTAFAHTSRFAHFSDAAALSVQVDDLKRLKDDLQHSPPAGISREALKKLQSQVQAGIPAYCIIESI